ncbi:MAG: AAA family ATPase [Chloroflexi bacterium]|nr:AAA family ATPase [Chloroflexota bacterium]
MYTPSTARADAAAMLAALWDGLDGNVCIMSAARQGGELTDIQHFWLPPARRDAVVAELARQTAAGREAFVSACAFAARQRRREHATHAHALWADLDQPPRMDHALPPPTLRVQTSTPDRQLWVWRLAAPIAASDAERLVRRIAAVLGADQQACDAARCLRPPGSLNTKHQPPLVARLLEHAPERVYDVAAIEAALPPEAPPANGQGQGVDWERLLDGVPEGERNRRLFEAACSLRHNNVPREAALAVVQLFAARCRPPLAASEAEAIVRSAWRYPPAQASPSLASLGSDADDAGDGGDAGDAAPRLVRLDAVVPTPLAWLWPSYLPLGKLVLLEGDPGLGKSLLALDLAARVTRGMPMPDGARGLDAPAGVVLLLAEDDLADTVRPRLDAAGADPARVVALQTAGDPTDPDRPPTTLDVEALRQAIQAVGARLLIVDPLAAFLPAKTDAHTDADVRRALAPLARLAASERVTVLAIRHLNKSTALPALYRGGGSIAFTAAARAVLLVARHPEDPTQRVLAPLKANLAPDAPALAFSITSHDGPAPRVAWGGATEYSASELLGGGTRDERPNALAAVHGALPTAPPGATPAELAAATGLAVGTVKNALLRLRALGQATQARYGRWLRPSPASPPSDASDGDASPPASVASRGEASLASLLSDGSDGDDASDDRPLAPWVQPSPSLESLSSDGDDGDGARPPPGPPQGEASLPSLTSDGDDASDDHAADPWPALLQRFRTAWLAVGHAYDGAPPPDRQRLAAAFARGQAFEQAWQRQDLPLAQATIAALEQLLPGPAPPPSTTGPNIARRRTPPARIAP